MKLGTKKGFTLVELMIVVIIIGILVSVALPQYARSVNRAKATEATRILGQIKEAEQVVLDATGAYTAAWVTLGMDDPSNAKWTYTIPAAAAAAFQAQASDGTDTVTIDETGTLVGTGKYTGLLQ
ncbi:MAG: prepilin-type N-terminal cleavage/methylation domain-containing protein [Candidatus Omnitrophota bacterium]